MRKVRSKAARRLAKQACWGTMAVLLLAAGCSQLAGVQAVLAVSRTKGPAPLSVQFDLSGSSPGAATGSYYLEFGDGTPMVEGSDFTLNIPHVYQSPGTYVAELTVVGDDGDLDQKQVAITVTDGLPSEGSVVGDLAIDFTATSTDGRAADHTERVARASGSGRVLGIVVCTVQAEHAAHQRPLGAVPRAGARRPRRQYGCQCQ